MKQKLKNTKGITLIALIVTIIVLLILAGVTIATLTGENGIITQANKAKEATEKATSLEKVQMEVAGSIGKDGKIDYDLLNENLRKNVKGLIYGTGEISEDDSNRITSLPAKVIVDGYEIKIEGNGKVSEYINVAEIGDYVKYDVTYKDMYTDYTFTATNGWRILDTGTPNGDGTYSGVKLISTGIPAQVHYYYNKLANGSTINNTNKPSWWGTEEQVRELYGDIYPDTGYIYSSGGYPGYFAAVGLFKNFASIPFKTNGTYNEGIYKNINGKTSVQITGSEFIATGALEVHNLTLEELNIARGLDINNTTNINTTDGDTGLFYLIGLENENAEYGYNSSKYPNYWLSYPHTSTRGDVKTVSYNGYLSYSAISALGVRPVVSLEYKIKKIGDIWEIQQ